MKRYWLSWVGDGVDYRPLNFPPNEGVIGWWCSGYTEDGATICALVRAESPQQCKDVIQKDWPEFDGEWRIEPSPKSDEWSPGDRFPMSGWMQERFATATA